METTKPVVLVADDQATIRITLEFLVKGIGGVQVVTAANGRAAVELAVKERPALVLMDVTMPEIDGYEACRMIKQGWGDHPGKIWLITARGSHFDSDQAREVGAEKFINKPFDPDRVVKMIKEVLLPAA